MQVNTPALEMGGTFVFSWMLIIFLRARVLDPVTVLAHPLRRKIMATVAAMGGAHLAGLRKATGVSYSTLLWHLRRLEMAGLVNHVRFTGEKKRATVFEVRPEHRPGPRDAPAVTRKEAKILERVTLEPGISKEGLRQKVMGAKTVGHTDLHGLEVRGLVTITRDGPTCRCFPTLWGLSALAAHRNRNGRGVSTERLLAYGEAATPRWASHRGESRRGAAGRPVDPEEVREGGSYERDSETVQGSASSNVLPMRPA